MSEWQPIDTAPSNTFVLLWGGQLSSNGDIEDNETAVVGRIKDVYGTAAWHVMGISGNDVWLWNPTHWMPLPEPPKEQEARQ